MVSVTTHRGEGERSDNSPPPGDPHGYKPNEVSKWQSIPPTRVNSSYFFSSSPESNTALVSSLIVTSVFFVLRLSASWPPLSYPTLCRTAGEQKVTSMVDPWGSCCGLDEPKCCGFLSSQGRGCANWASWEDSANSLHWFQWQSGSSSCPLEHPEKALVREGTLRTITRHGGRWHRGYRFAARPSLAMMPARIGFFFPWRMQKCL